MHLQEIRELPISDIGLMVTLGKISPELFLQNRVSLNIQTILNNIK